MNHDGSGETFLTRGGSPTWSPAGPLAAAPRRGTRFMPQHRARRGRSRSTRALPRSTATSSSSMSMISSRKEGTPENITADPDAPEAVDDDPDWSPDGLKIAFTSHPVTDDHMNSTQAEEIYVINPERDRKAAADVQYRRGARCQLVSRWHPDFVHVQEKWSGFRDLCDERGRHGSDAVDVQ